MIYCAVAGAWAAQVARGDLAWRPAGQRAAAPVAPRSGERSVLTSVVRDGAVQPAAAQQPASPAMGAQQAEVGRSVVVRRTTVGAAADGQAYDPFEEDDAHRAGLLIAAQPAAADPFDPFEEDAEPAPEAEQREQQPAPEEQAPAEEESVEAPANSAEPSADEPAPASDEANDEPEGVETESPSEPEAPVEPSADPLVPAEKPAAPGAKSAAPDRGFEEAFEEPQVVRPQQPPVEVETPDALLREVEQGASEELVPPTPPTTPAMPEPEVGADEEMTDELPGADTMEPDVGMEEDVDDEMQYGGPTPGEMAPLTPEQIEARRQELEKDRAESEENCEQILADVKANGITNINLDIKLKGNPGEDYPFECGLGNERFKPRSWPEITYLWKASGLCHKPLYFEQPQLERYGHSWGPALDPIVSGAHFFGTVPLLPYLMGVEAPGECIYTLGYYRPGSCAPYMIPAFPLSPRGAIYETGAVAGGILIFP